MANKFNYTVSVCSIIANDNGRPILPLIVDDSGEYRGYMMPFRNYGIDICATADGELTLGTSGVHGLDSTLRAILSADHPNSNSNPERVAAITVKGYCWISLMSFLANPYGDGVDITGQEKQLNTAFSKFAKKVVEFYKNR